VQLTDSKHIRLSALQVNFQLCVQLLCACASSPNKDVAVVHFGVDIILARKIVFETNDCQPRNFTFSWLL